MAIPSRQIGWGTQANLLWQISKQLERLICVAACECPTTTTTTSTEAPTTTTTTAPPVYFFDTDSSSTNSNYDACWSSQGNPGLYSLSNTLGVGVQIFQETELINPIPNGWYIYASDAYHVTGDNGFITETGLSCDSVLINAPNLFSNCSAPCGVGCGAPLSYYNIWLTHSCLEDWPKIGCRIYLDASATTWLGEGLYNYQGNGNCLTIDVNGYISNIP